MVFKFYNPGKIQDEVIRNVSVSLKLPSGWAFLMDSETKTYDLIHGQRDQGEAPCQAGLRILKERFHLEPDSIREVCPYSVDIDGEVSYGMLLFAKVEDVSVGACPSLEIFAKLPEKLSRGEATRRLFTGTQGWLNMQTNADELWDVYDENRNLTGRLHRRGDFLEEGDYHLVVHV